MLTPEAERHMAERKAAHRGGQFMRGEAGLLDSRFGARNIGVINEITPGMEAWTILEGRRNWHDDPLGGIVLHVDAGRPTTYDQETGERIEHPARYRCYDPFAEWPTKCFRTLAEPEIERGSIAVAEPSSVVIAIRRFCRHVANGPLDLDSFEAQLVTDAARLVAALLGTR